VSRGRTAFAWLRRLLGGRPAVGFAQTLEQALDASGGLSLRAASFERALAAPAPVARSRSLFSRINLSARLGRRLPASQEDRSHGSR
jgi:hypothetical protein